MQWWCAARTSMWTWEWTPYPGVWLFVGLLAAGWAALVRRHARAGAGRGGARPGATGSAAAERAGRSGRRTGGAPWSVVPRWRVVSFAAGLLLLWAALDWPVGPLAASYLASVHMAQLLTVSLVVPALLLLGTPAGVFRAWASRPVAGPLLGALTHPVAALLLYNGIVVGTHVPAVLDTLSATQAGMALMDLAWLAAGTLFWWPVLARAPRREWFGPFFRMGYLFLNTLPVTLPYAFLVFADFPLYATYELAPPFPGLATVEDQRIAGLVMKIAGGLIHWTAITVIFFRWYLEEEGGERKERRPARARSEAGG